MGTVGPVQVSTFRKRNGLFQLVTAGGSVLAEMDKVAILYSQLPDGSVIGHDFGTPKYIMMYHRWRKGEYERLGMTDMADEMRIAVSDEWTPEELNRARADNAFLTELLHGTVGTSGTPGEAPRGDVTTLSGQSETKQPVPVEGQALA